MNDWDDNKIMVDFSQRETPRDTQSISTPAYSELHGNVPEVNQTPASSLWGSGDIIKPTILEHAPEEEAPSNRASEDAVQGAGFIMTEPANAQTAYVPTPDEGSPFISVGPAPGMGSHHGSSEDDLSPGQAYGASTGTTSESYGYDAPVGGYGMQSSGPERPSYPSEVTPRSRTSKRKKKKPMEITKGGFVLALILAMLLTSLLSFGAMAAYDKYKSGSSKEAATYTLSPSNDNLDYKSIIAKAQDSVVSIVTEAVATDSWAQNYVTQGAGSGVIIKDNGYIITCNHVIEGARKITVTLRNKKSYEAELVGADPGNDIAVIKIDGKDLTAAEYGDSSKLVMGDSVVAIGNPLGQLSDTASAGIISSLNRELNIEGQKLNLLQTDASINPGNSGGGLFNSSGNLIGVVVAKSTGSDVEGLGFATPINKAAKIASEIIEKGGDVTSDDKENNDGNNSSQTGRVVIGINIVELSDEDAMQYGYDSGGVFIAGVTSANAMDAGLQAGDKLEEVDGTAITSSEQLSELLNKHKAGDEVEVLVSRIHGEFRTTVVLSSIDEE